VVVCVLASVYRVICVLVGMYGVIVQHSTRLPDEEATANFISIPSVFASEVDSLARPTISKLTEPAAVVGWRLADAGRQSRG
jgi:hypothetical protein